MVEKDPKICKLYSELKRTGSDDSSGYKSQDLGGVFHIKFCKIVLYSCKHFDNTSL